MAAIFLWCFRQVSSCRNSGIKEESHFASNDTVTAGGSIKDLLKHPHFVLAVVAQFLYVAAQTGINSFFINYVTEEIPSVTDSWVWRDGIILAGKVFREHSFHENY
jgi:fucose permease